MALVLVILQEPLGALMLTLFTLLLRCSVGIDSTQYYSVLRTYSTIQLKFASEFLEYTLDTTMADVMSRCLRQRQDMESCVAAQKATAATV